jgi:ribosomal protein S20
MEKLLEIKNNSSEKPEPILNDWDRKILIEGGEGVMRKIIEDQGIPDVVILPETSARPLYYLFNPSFKKLSQKMNTKPPEFVFFNVSSADWLTRLSETEKDVYERDDVFEIKISPNEVKEFVNKTYKEIYEPEEFESKKERIKESEKRVDETFSKRIIEEKHAKELLKKIKEKYGENPKIIIIDDFIASARAINETRRAFNLKIPSYSVFSMEDSPLSTNTKSGLEIYTQEYEENPTTRNHTRLSFGHGKLKRTVGVVKDKKQPLSTALNRTGNFTQEDQKKIIQLRKEMEELGEKLANSLNQDLV